MREAIISLRIYLRLPLPTDGQKIPKPIVFDRTWNMSFACTPIEKPAAFGPIPAPQEFGASQIERVVVEKLNCTKCAKLMPVRTFFKGESRWLVRLHFFQDLPKVGGKLLQLLGFERQNSDPAKVQQGQVDINTAVGERRFAHEVKR